MTFSNLEKRVNELEQDAGGPMPPWFVSWGREAGLSDAEIRAEWESIVNETGDSDPVATAWRRSLEGELFD